LEYPTLFGQIACRLFHWLWWRFHYDMSDFRWTVVHAGCPTCGRVYRKKIQKIGDTDDLFWWPTDIKFDPDKFRE